ncbi:unnamed protein product [Closterium sp. NIES-53]
MDSTSGAVAFTRCVLDLARRLAALDVVYPETVICCHLLEGLTPAFDAHKLAYMLLLSKHHTLAEVSQWIITTQAEILRHSTSKVAIAQPCSSKGGRGGGRGVGRGGGRGGGQGGSPGHGVNGSGGAGRGGAVAFPPCQYLPRYGPTQGQRCGQTTHAIETCFKALSDEWFARGNTGTPPRWSALNLRSTPLEQLPHFQQQLPLLPPPPVSQQQPFPTWTTGSAASVAHLSGASQAPSAGGNVTAFPSSGFVGLLGQPDSVASPMYPSCVNETLFQYSSSPSSTLDFIVDSGATDIVLRDAGTLRPLPTPTSLLSADSSFSIPCHNTSTLPCPLFPSGIITGLHIPSLRTNLLF